MATFTPLQSGDTGLILASASKGRAALLSSAGVSFRQEPADIDEKAIRSALQLGGEKPEPEDVAMLLACTKAEAVSAKAPAALVIAADQILTCDGEIFEKPATMDEARDQLFRLRGKTHQLHAALCLAREGDFIWQHLDSASLTMRHFSPEFLGRYLAAAGETILHSVGAYQLEAAGIQLFSRIDGDYFTILGLPLLPLLDHLREINVLTS